MSEAKRILVTGGSGFIGTNLVKHLVEAGHQVFNLDVAPPQLKGLCPHLAIDIRDAEALSAAIGSVQPELIFHFAARVDLDGKTISDYDSNTVGVANLTKAAQTVSSVQRVVYASSQLVCTPGYQPRNDFDFNPPNAYGESKVLGEQLVRSLTASSGQSGERNPFSWVLLRPTSIWGPYFGPLYSAFLRTVRDGRYVHPKGHRVRKSFGFVGNAVHQISQVGFGPDEAVYARVLYVADYEPYPIYEWAQMAAKYFGARNIVEVPTMALRAAALAGDLLHLAGMKHPPLTSYRFKNMLTETVFDLSDLRDIAGDLPYNLDEATQITVEWMKANKSQTG